MKTGPILRKGEKGLSAVSAFDAEQLAAFPVGTEFDLKPRTKRSLPQQRLYWGMLAKVREATWLGDRYPTSEHLHDELLRDLGFVTLTYTLDGAPRVVRDSTAFDAMKGDEFKGYLDRALDRLARITGVDPLTLTTEAAAA